MSFSELEIQQCAFALGYGLKPLQLKAVRDAMTNVPTVTEELIRQELQDWQGAHKTIKETAPFAAATFQSGPTGSRQYSPALRMHTIHEQARHHIQQLSVMLDVPIFRDIYALVHSSTRTIKRA